MERGEGEERERTQRQEGDELTVLRGDGVSLYSFLPSFSVVVSEPSFSQFKQIVHFFGGRGGPIHTRSSTWRSIPTEPSI